MTRSASSQQAPQTATGQSAALPSSAERSAPDFGFGSKGYRSYVLGALLIVYIFNFIDRTIINILTEPIKDSFGVEDWQMGLLGGPAFAVLYTFLGIPVARFAERAHRVWIIAVAVVVWSLMTALCGIAFSFLMLLLFRIGVSVGEAGCTPPAQSLIADYFRPTSRATAVSIYALGVPLGSMLAAVFGGFIAGNLGGSDIAAALSSWGWTWALDALNWDEIEAWRVAFVLVGVPGIIVGILVKLTIKEPPRGYTDPVELQNQPAVSFGDALKVLAGKPTLIHVVIGATITAFVGYGVGQFVTSFLIRTHGLDIQTAALLFGILLGVMSSIGVFASGFIADKIAARHPNALTWIPALGMGVAAPLFVIGYLMDNLTLALVPLMIASLANSLYLGPMYAVAGGVVDSRMRATSVAVTLFMVNLIGYGLGPLVIGILSTVLKTMFLSGAGLGLDLNACREVANLSAAAVEACASADARGLRWSIVVFASLYGWAAIHFLLAGRTLQDDLVTKRG